jgi:hypothetical protein
VLFRSADWSTGELAGLFVRVDADASADGDPRWAYIVENDASTVFVWGDVTGWLTGSAPHGYEFYDLEPTPGSPCIDAADGAAAPNADLRGSGRIDLAGAENEGVGVPAYADIGALELVEGCGTDGVTFFDRVSGLCWQDDGDLSQANWFEASGEYDAFHNPGVTDICGDLVLGGHDDWRLPEIDELVGLVRGCVDGSPTSDLSVSTCGLDDPSCLEDSCNDGIDCDGCPAGYGPSDDSNYHHLELIETHYDFWSSSLVTGVVPAQAWCVYFRYGSNYGSQRTDSNTVRCVRD